MISDSRKSLLAASLSIVTAFCLFCAVPAYATPPEQQSEPTQEEIDAIKLKASEMPIYKESNGALVLDTESNGDLEKRSFPAGEYPTRKGTILVTDEKFSGLIETGHAAIVYNGSNTVVESLGNGVVIGANDWYKKTAYVWGLATFNLSFAQADIAADWCARQVGKPYNFNFLDTMRRDKFYCSQLVWASFYDNFGVDISTPFLGSIIYPIEILESPEVVMMYRNK